MRINLAPVGILAIVCTVLLPAAPASALGSMGHYYLAKWYAQKVLDGTVAAPAELREVLKDPLALEAFCIGAFAPDSGDAAVTHQGKNGDRARAILKGAQDELKTKGAPDEQASARRKVAFSYGWITHLAADDVAHPLINLRAGDTWRNLGYLGMKEHARWEILLDASIFLAVDPGGNPYDISVHLTPELKDHAKKHGLLDIDGGALKRDAEALLVVLKTKDPLFSGFSWWFGLTDFSMTPENQIKILVEFFLPWVSSCVNNPELLGNADRDVGSLTAEEFDQARATFLECLRREPDGLLLPNLYANVAAAIGASTTNVCLLVLAASDGLGAIETTMASLEQADAALQRFRAQATTVAAALRQLQARYDKAAAAPAALGRRITDEPTMPAACRSLEDLARQADSGRLTLASLRPLTAEVRKTLDERRAQLQQPDPGGAAGPRESEFLAALESYRALTPSSVLGRVNATLATRAASVSLPTAEMPELGPLPVVTARLKSQARCLQAEVALLSSIPEAARARLFPGNVEMPDEAKRCEKYAADFLASSRVAYEAVDTTAIAARFDALQQKLTEGMAADAELRALVAGIRKALEVVRLRQGERTRAQLQRQDLEGCEAQLVALERQLAAPTPPLVPRTGTSKPETSTCAAACGRAYDKQVAGAAVTLKRGWSWSTCPTPLGAVTNACVKTWMDCDGRCGLYQVECKTPCWKALQSCCEANELLNAAHRRDACLQQCPK